MKSEREAEAARRDLGIGLESQVPDLLRLLEDEAGLRVFIVSLPEDGIDGAYQVDRGESFALINQEKHPTRKRFTLAHEFGHHRLGHGAQLDSHIDPLRDRRLTEIEANRFAGAFLMPRPAIDDWFARHDDPALDLETLVRIAFAFNVSAYVVLFRLQAVKRLKPSAHKKHLLDSLVAEKHYEVARALGLMRAQDSIEVEDARGGYIPASMQARIADLVRRGLLSEDAAKARLHLPEPAATRRVRELLAPSLFND
jgi:Zn-dependent peptidase ImmA (M78 family)